jgi:predicted Zn finger-like uncharacterized protein
MILTCPNCGARYQTDRGRLAPPGGNVRCAKCLTAWFHAVSDVEEALELDPGEAPPAMSSADIRLEKELTAQSIHAVNGTRLALFAGWGALFLFIGAFAWGAIAFRHEIATVWPQSSSFYAAINLPVNIQGLAVTDIGYDHIIENGENVLRISGQVTNTSEVELAVPGIFVSLRDGDEREIYAWTINVGIALLGPGQSRPFLTHLPNPPPELREVDVIFVSDAGP